jgi:hypothetical protein
MASRNVAAGQQAEKMPPAAHLRLLAGEDALPERVVA